MFAIVLLLEALKTQDGALLSSGDAGGALGIRAGMGSEIMLGIATDDTFLTPRKKIGGTSTTEPEFVLWSCGQTTLEMILTSCAGETSRRTLPEMTIRTLDASAVV